MHPPPRQSKKSRLTKGVLDRPHTHPHLPSNSNSLCTFTTNCSEHVTSTARRSQRCRVCKRNKSITISTQSPIRCRIYQSIIRVQEATFKRTPRETVLCRLVKRNSRPAGDRCDTPVPTARNLAQIGSRHIPASDINNHLTTQPDK